MEGLPLFPLDVHMVLMLLITIMQVTHRPRMAVTVIVDPAILVIAVKGPLQDFQQVEVLVTQIEQQLDELQ